MKKIELDYIENKNSLLRELSELDELDEQTINDIYEEDYTEIKERLLQELDELEERETYRITNPVSDMTKKHNPEAE